jgi:chromosome segregation ATPase
MKNKGGMMGKRILMANMALACILFMVFGCSALQKMKGPSADKKQQPAGGLYASVPESLRAPVQEAAMDLQQAKSNLKLADNQVILADLIKEHGNLKKKYADLNRKLAEIEVHKAEATIERRKQEAIDNANLGDRSTNIKKIAELRTKELDIESDGVKTKAEMDTLDLAIKKLENKINHQSDIVAGHK